MKQQQHNLPNLVAAPVLALGMGLCAPVLASEFNNMHQQFNAHMQEVYQTLHESYETSKYADTSSMRYFDEEANAYIIKLRTTMPKDALEVGVYNNYLVISGKQDADNAKSNFSHTMSLPKYADSKNILASFEEQILTITIPRKNLESPALRTIEIK